MGARPHRFVLVDPSIVGPGGHYHEYAARVLSAAAARGFEAVLLASRAFTANADLPWRVLPVFHFDFWGAPSPVRVTQGPSLTDADQRFLRWRHSRPGLLWAAASRLSRLREYGTTFPLPRSDLERLRWMIDVTRRASTPSEPMQRTSERELDASERDRLNALRPRSPEQRRAHYADLRARLIDGLRQSSGQGGGSLLAPEELRSLDAMALMADQAEAFEITLGAALRELGLGHDDQVFIPTVAYAELRGLHRLLERDATLRAPIYHLLFRRDLYSGFEESHALQEWRVHDVRTAFAVVASLAPAVRLRFYSDTQPLVDQYQRLESVRFRLAPIPVKRSQPTEPAADAPLTITYLGDARAEKGYQYLPQLVEGVLSRPANARRSRFLLHSFQAGRPNVEMSRAKALLALYPAADVTLVETPRSSQAYDEDLRASQILLVPYARHNYIARSSGVFVEALAAGIPVVTTSGTWMAAVMDALAFDVHRRALESARRLETRGASSLPWRAYYGGQDDRPEGCLTGEDTIRVSGQPTSYTSLPVTPGASHLWVTFTGATTAGGAGHVHVIVAQQDENGRELRVLRRIVGGAAGSRYSIVVPLTSATRRLWIAFRNAFSASPLTVRELRFEQLQTSVQVPTSPLGTTFDEGTHPAEHVANLTRAVVELIDDYPAISRTAREHASAWGDFHSGAALVRTLLEAAQDPAPVTHHAPERFVARSW